MVFADFLLCSFWGVVLSLSVMVARCMVPMLRLLPLRKLSIPPFGLTRRLGGAHIVDGTGSAASRFSEAVQRLTRSRRCGIGNRAGNGRVLRSVACNHPRRVSRGSTRLVVFRLAWTRAGPHTALICRQPAGMHGCDGSPPRPG